MAICGDFWLKRKRKILYVICLCVAVIFLKHSLVPQKVDIRTVKASGISLLQTLIPGTNSLGITARFTSAINRITTVPNLGSFKLITARTTIKPTTNRGTKGPTTGPRTTSNIWLTDPTLQNFKRDCEIYPISKSLPATQGKPRCPCVPRSIEGRKSLDLAEPTWEQLEADHADMEAGGHWTPNTCDARQRACLLVPYRDREIHLKIWLKNIIPYLQKQNLDFTIFLAEQNAGVRFNRGMLINVAFVQAAKLGAKCDCIIIHDVDHIPEDDRLMYYCLSRPIHMAVARNSSGYKLIYNSFIGGVIALESGAFSSHNGFSNLYFGWGSEDDDVYERITKVIHRPIQRYSALVARYTMLGHVGAQENKDRFTLVRAWRRRWASDGVKNVMERCSIKKIEKKKLFTHIFVDLDEQKVKEGTGFN